jgi:DnaK suppressor protein
MADPTTSADARAALLAERERVLAELAGIEVEGPGQMTYGSQAAAATHVFEQQRDLALRERNEQHLAAVDAALARLDAGTYGLCQSCGKPIAPERLEALPSAALCIDCQRSARRR